MTEPVALVSCGPSDHGIVRFARELAIGIRSLGFGGVVLHEPDPARLTDLIGRLPADVRLVHLQANDWLFSHGAVRADARVAQFADLLRSRGARLSLTLHDLPQRGVTRELFLRRAGVYAAMVRAASGVVVCSEHERLLLAEAELAAGPEARVGTGAEAAVDIASTNAAAGAARVEVIPLPVVRGEPFSDVLSATGRASLGILGFVYPGKGHREVLDELADLEHPPVVIAIGSASAGHDDLLTELLDLATRRGVDFRCTGFVPDGQLTAMLRTVTVPVAPHPQVSASASINTWLAAGRRPLVMAGRYTRELTDRMPGSVWLYHPGGLGACVQEALDEPARTWLPPDFHPDPSPDEVAHRYLTWLRALASQPG